MKSPNIRELIKQTLNLELSPNDICIIFCDRETYTEGDIKDFSERLFTESLFLGTDDSNYIGKDDKGMDVHIGSQKLSIKDEGVKKRIFDTIDLISKRFGVKPFEQESSNIISQIGEQRYYIETDKQPEALKRIFKELVNRGFIARTDPKGKDMQQRFLDAFNPSASEQGYIIWKWTTRRGGVGAKPSKRNLLEFIVLMAGTVRTFHELSPMLSAVFPNVNFNSSDYSKFIKLRHEGRYPECHDVLIDIFQ